MKTIYTIVLMFSFFQGWAQNTQTVNSNAGAVLTDASAASALRTAQATVNKSTGIPQINYPVATLQGKSATIPVALSYDASGRKVMEDDGEVGWGWSLIAGGVITRNTVGHHDEWTCSGGFIPSIVDENGNKQWDYWWNGDNPWVDGALPETFNASNEDHQDLASDATYKYQPDEFYFSLPNGRSGMFVINPSGEAVLIPYQPYRIEIDPRYEGFTITDETGMKYIFISRSISYTVTPDAPNVLGHNGLAPVGTFTTWYLDEIQDAQSETEFLFFYENLPHKESSEYVDSKLRYDGTDCPDDIEQDDTHYVYHTESKRILSIQSGLGSSIEFDYFIDSSLNGIIIKDISGNESYSVWLYHNVFQTEGGIPNWRLKLESIRVRNSSNEFEQPTLFEYNNNDGNLFPAQYSNVYDYWGYYNGLTQEGLKDTHILGGLRKVDPDYGQMGILKAITHPNGSSTSFEYETNQYSESPNGMVSDLNISTEKNFNCESIVTNSNYIEYITPPSTQFSNPCCLTSIPVGQQQNLCCLVDIPSNNCGLGYTFYHPTTHNPEFHEGDDNIFDIEDLNDVDRPTNTSLNTDLQSNELCYIPEVKNKFQTTTFFIEFAQDIELTGTISESFCEDDEHRIEIIRLSDNSVVWFEESANGQVTQINELLSLTFGMYRIECKVFYPYFNDVHNGYLPLNFQPETEYSAELNVSIQSKPQYPSANAKYGGGLRVKSIIVDDGDSDVSNSQGNQFEYNKLSQLGSSSGYLLSDPRYSYEIEYYLARYKMSLPGCGGNDDNYCHECDMSYWSEAGLNQLINANGSFVLYSSVQTKQVDGNGVCSNGRVEEDFSIHPSENGDPVIGDKITYKNWRSGLPIASKVWDQDGQILTESSQTYSQILSSPESVKSLFAGINHYKYVGGLVQSCDNYDNECSIDFTYSGLVRQYESEIYAPTSAISRHYDQSDPTKFTESTTSYTYTSAISGLPSEIVTQTSDPLKPFTVQKIKYVGDYAVSANGDAMTTALNYLINTGEFGLNTPVETITLQGTSLSTLKVIGGSINTFKMQGGKVVADATYKLELASPVNWSSAFFSSVSGSNFVMNGNYRKIAHLATYDSEERPTSSQKENDILTTVIRDYTDGRVVAEVVNATPEKCAYTSFETDNGGGWTYYNQWIATVNSTVLGFTLAKAKTGTRKYSLQGGAVTRNLAPGSYVLSLWSSTPAITITLAGSAITATVFQDGQDVMGWAYYEYIINCTANATLSIGGSSSAWLDELRLYPKDASMKTTAYSTDGTVRSSCGVNNRVTTYLYDNWKRLEWTLDDNWEILTHQEYHIKNQNDPNDHSWTKEQVVMEEGMTKEDVLNASPYDEEVVSTITYSDGLGRPLQSLAVRQSPSDKDIVSFHQYDALGREPRKYLPFTIGSGNNGDFVVDAVAEVMDFYDGTLRVAETAYPFAETEYEASPLSRPLRMGNVGEEWQLSTTHVIETQTLLNDASEVLLWQDNGNNFNAMDGTMPAYYPANTLIKKEVEDEHGQKMWEYTNALGQVVCKRARAWMSGTGTGSYSWTPGNGNIGDEGMAYLPGTEPSWRNLDTYFIYDAFGRLKYEMPAIAVMACNGDYFIQPVLGGQQYSIFDGYMTAYKYDYRGRQIEKKKPGEGWSEYVYNNLNQVILSHSPALGNGKWNYVKYDLLGRPVQTGFYTTGSTRAAMQLARDGETTNMWETKSGNTSNPYNTTSFPSNSIEILTETYYDDYAFDINSYTYNYYGTPAKAQAKRTRGAVTGSKTLVLDGGTSYLTSVSYYDTDGRLAVQFAENMLGGMDKVLTEYDYTGKVTQTTRKFRKGNGSLDELTIINSFEYDHAGRPTKTIQQIGSDQEVVLSELVYNELGQVVKKHLHQTAETNSGMQVVDYRYNERGWLTKINNADLVNDGDNLEGYDVFGEELIYHEENRYYSTVLDMHQQFNGNIGAIKWKTNRNPDAADGAEMPGHSYVFRYDKLGQMLGAFYAKSMDTYIDDYSYKAHSWDEKASYDANGNIRSMMRKRPVDENGTPYGTPATMDQLSYTYMANSNKVLTIQDSGQDNWISNSATNPYTHFIDNNAGGIEYTYDTEGRTLTDANKGLGFEYNHLDLVKRAYEGSEAVNFVWDATGQKLKKTVGTTSTYYFNGIEYTNDDLTSLATSEGIARSLDGGLNNGDWVYDYYLKDHLGNVRAIITEEGSEPVVEKVTVELEKRVQEDANFNNVSATEKDKPYLYPYDPADPTSQKVSELNSLSGKVIGPAKVLAIEAGETIDLSAKYWYTEAPGDPLTSVTEILAGTLLNLGAASGGIIPSGPETGMALLNNVSGDQFGAFYTFINDAFDDVDFSKPQAYLVYMYFNKNMELDAANSGVIQVGDANALGQLTMQGITAKDDGFFYTYVTNQSAGKVNFDNMTIVHWAPVVRVVYDYYPYGLTWENPKLPTDPDAVHDHCYQDKEFQFAEFTTGHGLALYDFHARMYDPAMARWLVPDPAAQFANPYLAMGNNPVICVDPDGRFIGEFFDALEYVSPIVIRPVLHSGTDKRGWGWEISIGVPKIIPISYRWEYGETYYKNGYAEKAGREIKKGGEMTYFWIFSVGGYHYSGDFANGEFTQTTGVMTIGVPFANIKYENDIMPPKPKFMSWILANAGLGIVPKPDEGDRYRSAGMKVQLGGFSFGFELFTGDPGFDKRDRAIDEDYKDSPNGGYIASEHGDPDKYREGIVYFGIGPFRFGGNNEANRHRIQNRFAHDKIGVPWFRILEIPNRKYFYFGTGSASGVY